mmetsp:Transcript_11713/g.22352  ORF Transcript_11713/g.22352 Transcript_11713/m.22352 type:complete len:214 (+) Transcript_11713:353-994(+)
MVSRTVHLGALRAGCMEAASTLRLEMKTRGYGLVRVDDNATLRALTGALRHFRGVNQFRFPPFTEPTGDSPGLRHWPFAYRRAVCVLLQSAVSCFSALAPLQADMMASKEATRDTCKNLTRRSFQTSFVNIFNYDLGYLNSHRDRCLVTVIFSEKQEHNRMRLWVKPATSDQPMVFRSSHPGRDGWLDVDTVRDSHDLVVFTGEDMEQVTEGL